MNALNKILDRLPCLCFFHRKSKFRLCKLLSLAGLLLGLYTWKEHAPALALQADPTGGILTSLAISFIVSGVTSLAQRLLTPKPAPVVKGKLQGDVQIQGSEEGIFIPEIYGGDPGDNLGGGVKLAGNIIWTSGIRKTVTTTPGHGGGKGAPPSPPEQTITYDLDLAIMWARGPVELLMLWANTDLIYNGLAASGFVTGVVDPTVPGEVTYNPHFPPDPTLSDVNPITRFSKLPTPDVTTGTTNAQIVAGAYASLRHYQGTQTQLPDPVVQATVDVQFGSNSTPAYRGRSYTVLEKFNLSRYSSVPNFRALLAHSSLRTLDGIAADRCVRAGLADGDFDFSALEEKAVRGLLIAQRQAPRQEFTSAGQVYYVEFVETPDGKLIGVDLADSTIQATIDESELGFAAGEAGSGNAPPQLLETTFPDPLDVPRRVDVRHYDPERDYEYNLRHGARFVTSSEHETTIELPFTLTKEEARVVAERQAQLGWLERGSNAFALGYKYAWLKPTDIVEINRPSDGFTHQIRLMERQGSVPGVLKMVGVNYAQPIVMPPAGESIPTAPLTSIPANSVIAFIDVKRLRDADSDPGMYVAATSRDSSTGQWHSASVFWDRGAGFEPLITLPDAATMGRAVTVLADVPGGWATGDWDDTNSVTVDLYYGELDTPTSSVLADRKTNVLDSGNCVMVVGAEVVQFATAARVGGFANRWTISNLQRQLRNTPSASHAIHERAVLVNSAVRFAKMDANQAGLARDYKCVTAGQHIDDAALLTFTWTGAAIPVAPALDSVDSAVPTIGGAPTVTKSDTTNDWIVYVPLPSAFGYSASNCEIRVCKASDSSLVRTVPLGLATRATITMASFDCNIDYRWRNGFRGGGSDGWSGYSPTMLAAGIGSGTGISNDSGLGSFNNDPHDSTNPDTRQVIYEL